MKIHVLQHIDFEPPGAVADWIVARGHELSLVRVDLGQALPRVEEIDALISLGGPVSVHDGARASWLGQEKRLVSALMSVNKPVIGICLGAQIIADVLGARVYEASEKEIGWHHLTWSAGASRLFTSMKENPDSTNTVARAESLVFHWHGESFELPSGAELLASSEATSVQAFKIGGKILAMQFHLELNPENVHELLLRCGSWIDPTHPYQQDPASIAAHADEGCRGTKRLLYGALDGFLARSPS